MSTPAPEQLSLSSAHPDTDSRRNPYGPTPLRPKHLHLGVGLGRGLSACFLGLKYMARNPLLIPFAVLPVLINTIVMTITFIASFVHLLRFAMTHVNTYESPWLYWPILILAILGVLVTATIIMLMVWIFMRATVSAWFEAKLAEECAKKLGVPILEDDGSTFRYILETSVLLFVLLVINLLILLLNFIPIIGSILSLILGYYVNSWAAGWQYFGLALEQRGLPLSQRLGFSFRHHGDVVGTGAWVMLLGIIPLIGPITLSGTVVGSVLLSSRLWEYDIKLGTLEAPTASETSEP